MFGLSDRGPILPPTGAARSAVKMGPTSRWTKSSVIWEARPGGLTPLLDGSSSQRLTGEPYLSMTEWTRRESTDREGPCSFEESNSRHRMGGPYRLMDGLN